jgi:hypothetical protein
LMALSIAAVFLLLGCGESGGTAPVVDGGDSSPVDGGAAADGAKDGDAASSDPCPSGHFMDLSGVEGPGAGYDDPFLSVTCAADTVTVVSNGLPHYTFAPITPNALLSQDHQWTFPLHPEVAPEVTTIPLLGTVAAAINGCPVYGPNEAQLPDPFGDPIYNQITDAGKGHTGGAGDYHFHALVTAVFYPEAVDGEPSPVLGYALDGFPIYGPWGCVDLGCEEVVKFESSWEQIGDPATYAWDNHACTATSCDAAEGASLDRCNGRVGPDGTYRYHATDGFPYVLGCYRGTATVAAGDGPPPGGGGPP